MKLYLANPSGFCAGVQRAVDTVKRSLAEVRGTVHVRHEIVHNRHVVDDLRREGAVFVEDIEAVPTGAHVIVSAHGAGRKVHEAAARRGLQVVDATCPLVRKVHTEIQRYHAMGKEVILIGDPKHPEVQASRDQSDGVLHVVSNVEQANALNPTSCDRLAYVTQTTLSVDDCALVVNALVARFPDITAPRSSDICYAAQNRQAAVKRLAEHTRHIVIVGSANSSNSKRLRDVAERAGCTAVLLDEPDALQAAFLHGADNVGLAAGASSPQVLVDQFIERLKALGVTSVTPLEAAAEDVEFTLPPFPMARAPQ